MPLVDVRVLKGDSTEVLSGLSAKLAAQKYAVPFKVRRTFCGSAASGKSKRYFLFQNEASNTLAKKVSLILNARR